jgi:membrane-associated phospholipid phosphatase
VTLVVSALLLVAVTADVLLRGPLTWVDHEVPDLVRSDTIRAADTPWRLLWSVKGGFYAMTQFGARETALLVVLPLVLVVSWRCRTVRPLARLAVLGVLVLMAVVTLKYGIGRTAPTIDLVHTTGKSFPSGHTTSAVLLWGLVAWTAADYATSAPLRRAAAALRWAGPGFAGTGMTVLAYHWLTDVIAGAAMGVLLLGVLHVVDRTVLAHLPGAQRGIAGAGGADRRRVDAARSPAARVRRRGDPLHDPRPAHR